MSTGSSASGPSSSGPGSERVATTNESETVKAAAAGGAAAAATGAIGAPGPLSSGRFVIASERKKWIGVLWLQLMLAGIGVVAAALLAVALTEFFRVTNPSRPVEVLIGIGAFAAIVSMGSFLWSIPRRSQLIYEFRESAMDLTALVVRQDFEWEVDKEGEWGTSASESDGGDTGSRSPVVVVPDGGLSRDEVLNRIVSNR